MSTNPKGSGDGSRPTTDGGVANIGAGGAFDTGRAATGEPNEGPAHPERLQDKRADAAGERLDESVPFGLHSDKTPQANTEPPPDHGGEDAPIALQDARGEQPDGPNVAPSAHEHEAAQGQATSGAPAADGREERIRAAAYALAAGRGFAPGHEIEDWLQAERQFDHGDAR